jgi:2-hydroxychromene-2-carboxylate isomerase
VTETIRFHFDPACPWAWQSARWMREVAAVRDVEIEWRLFSLKTINAVSAGRDVTGAEITPALRTLALVRREAGNDGVARLYDAIGARVHEGDAKPTTEVVAAALEDAGFEPDLVDRAMGDESTAQAVRADHEAAVAEVGAFGVPTIVLPSGKAIFGPVVASAPKGDAAVELWDHVRYFVELDGFYELKRDRTKRAGSP